MVDRPRKVESVVHSPIDIPHEVTSQQAPRPLDTMVRGSEGLPKLTTPPIPKDVPHLQPIARRVGELTIANEGHQKTLAKTQEQLDGMSWYQKIPGFRREYLEKKGLVKDLQKEMTDNSARLALHQEALGVAKTPEQVKLFQHLIDEMPPASRPTSIKDVMARVKNGENVLQQVLSGTIDPKSMTPQQHLNSIVDLQWALYARAVAKDQGITAGGNTVVEDPDKKVFKFMNDYKGTYARWMSSHFKDAQIEGMHNRGIDVPGDENGNPILPAGKRHILFGALDNGSTFSKWEWHGTNTWGDLYSHMGTFKETRGLQGGGRKEHTPEDVMKQFNDSMIRAGKKLTSKEKADVKRHGIKAMMDIAKKNGFENWFRQYLTEGTRPLDNLNLRKGNEVVLSRDELGRAPHPET